MSEALPRSSAPVYSPDDPELDRNPYEVWRWLRDEEPLYHNEELGFWAVSRFQDVREFALDWQRFSSARGALLGPAKRREPVSLGNFAFEDPPLHNGHRQLLASTFAPRRIAALEPALRAACRHILEVGRDAGGLDFAVDLGIGMSLRAIELLFDIPEDMGQRIRRYLQPAVQDPQGSRSITPGLSFGISEYVRWRLRHPTEDRVTALAAAHIEDPVGGRRALGEAELLTCVWVVAVAALETTAKLIGWTGYCLARWPDQRRLLVEDPALIPGAVEELLRYESPAAAQARTVTVDVHLYDRLMPAGSVVLLLSAAANRDDRAFPDPDRLDVRRRLDRHVAFGYGVHFCLGNAVARLLGRIVLEETLGRFPEWELIADGLVWDDVSISRGWHHVPVGV